MVKKCKIVPKFSLPDLIPYKRIEYPCEMELNKAEIIRAMNYADVYEILESGEEILLDPVNFDEVNSDTGGGDEPGPDDPDPDKPNPGDEGVAEVIDGPEENILVNQVAGLETGGINIARLY